MALRSAISISQQPLKRYGNKTPINKLKICALVGYYAAYNGNSLPTFRYNLLVTYSRVSPTRTRRKPEIKHSTRLWEGYIQCVMSRASKHFESGRPNSLLRSPSYRVARTKHCNPRFLQYRRHSRTPAASTSFWAFFFDFLTPEDGTDKFPRDVGKELPR
jgi:hypothetical protein